MTSRVEMTNGELGKKPFNLTDHFFDTTLVCDGRLDDLVTGMCFQGAEQVNNIMSDGLRNRLFPHNSSSSFGGDLAVRNIMVSTKLQLLLMWFEMVLRRFNSQFASVTLNRVLLVVTCSSNPRLVNI